MCSVIAGIAMKRCIESKRQRKMASETRVEIHCRDSLLSDLDAEYLEFGYSYSNSETETLEALASREHNIGRERLRQQN